MSSYLLLPSEPNNSSKLDLTTLLANIPKSQNRTSYSVAVEGNIGCGKSTLLQHFQSSSQVECLYEPVDEWCNYHGCNPLEMLYTDSKRWSYTFNTMVMLSRLKMQNTQSVKPVKLMERSVLSTQRVFVEKDFVCGNLNEVEYNLLNEWADYLRQMHESPVDLYVYLRTDPAACYERVQCRARPGEETIALQHLENLHEFYDKVFLNKQKRLDTPILVMQASDSADMMTEMIESHRQFILCGTE